MQAIEAINGRPAVSVSWMVANDILSSSNYKLLIHRGDMEQARRACKGQTAMVFADNMPLRFRNKIIEMVGDIYEAMQTSVLKVEHDAQAAKFYDEYETNEGKLLPEDKRREYYGTACVMNAITTLLREREGKSKAMGGRSGKCWGMIISELQKVDNKMFAYKLPDNERSLERKWQRYNSEGYESIVHKNYSNVSRNAAKVDSDDQTKALIEILTTQNWDMEQCAKIYNSIAKRQGWKEVTAKTVGNFATAHKPDIYAARHGKNALSNNIAMQTKRRRPSAPLLYWTRDGWKAELFYQDENKLYNSLTIEVVIDTYCDYPIGYAISDREGVVLINEAMRNAVKHTEDLFGQMYRVWQLQSDNYGRAGMKETDEDVSHVFTPAKVGNAKSKVIEPYFKKLNHDYCAMLPNWSGYGVTSRKDSQPNPEMVKLRSKSFPNREACIKQLEMIIEMEREKKREKMLEGFKKLKDKFKVPMSRRDYLSLWGVETETRALLKGNGLLITIGGVKRTFDCFDQSMRRHPSERWMVKYDPDDIHQALAISEDGRLVYEIEEKYVQPMALADRQPGDAEQLQRIRDFNAQLSETATRLVCESSGTVAKLMSQKALDDGENPLMIEGADTYQKMLLTDRQGRHKDVLNDIRCGESETKEVSKNDATDDEDDVFNDY